MPVWIPYQPPAATRRSSKFPLNDAARRAVILMLLITIFLAGMGGLIAAMRHVLGAQPLPPELQSQIHQVESQLHVPFMVFLRAVYLVMLTLAIVVGVLCVWIRRGTLLPLVLAMIVDGFALLFMGIALFGALAAVVTVGGPQPLASLSVWMIALAVGGLLFSWLLQAARSPREPLPAAVSVEASPGVPSRGLGYGAYAPPPPLPRRDDA